MIKTFATVELPVDETLELQKCRLEPNHSTSYDRRICIVTGIHGDELEGQYVCYELQRRIAEDYDALNGIVDIYPAFNPLGIDSITRGIPQFDMDMNRIFPGNEDGSFTEYLAARLVRELEGADLCIDVHASDIFLNETLQTRILPEFASLLLPYARQTNMDYIWVSTSATVKAATLAWSLNKLGVPTLAIETGSGMRINRNNGNRIVDGIMNILKERGLWFGKVPQKISSPREITAQDIAYENAASSGIFLPDVTIGDRVVRGQQMGCIVNALTGEEECVLKAICDGTVFTMREYPIVYCGALLYRIVKDRG